MTAQTKARSSVHASPAAPHAEPGSIAARIAGLEHLVAVVTTSGARSDDAVFTVLAANERIAILRAWLP